MTRCLAVVLLIATAAVPAAAQPRSNVTLPGESMFQSVCGFCHGRDATGGVMGPDLTDSELVAKDRNGNLMGPVIRNGRIDKGMPGFSGMSARDLKLLVDYIHARKAAVDKNPGRRRKVSVADLSTGNAEAGRTYFNGAGGCAVCHSPTGDLAGLAVKYKGLALLQRFLYPSSSNAAPLAPGEKPRPSPVTMAVTLPSGETISGPQVFRDEFTIALRDADGWFRSWPRAGLKVEIKDPLEAHAAQLPKYTDDDVHNLFAFLQTLR